MRRIDIRWVVLVVFGMVVTAPSSVRGQDWSWPERLENLQVLPNHWTGQRLRPVMTGFARALGVRCSHCHVGEEGAPLGTYDFASDDNPNKERARTMLRMLGDINETLKTIEPSGLDRVNMWCHTCHRGRPRPMTLDEDLKEVYKTEGVEAVIDRYVSLREKFFGRGAYDFGEGSLNSLGYAIMAEGDFDAAVRIFVLNVDTFPESGNVYDSLGEAYMNLGQTDLAIENYERSLDLGPGNDNAVKRLEELRSSGGG